MRTWLALVIATAVMPLADRGTVAKNASDDRAQPEAIYLWPVHPPEGWFHDRESSRKAGVQIMTPRPTDSDAIIYVEASLKKKELDLSIAESHEALRRSAPDTKIVRMPEVSRSNGLSAFQSYRYETPSKRYEKKEDRRPSVEYRAFGEGRHGGKSFQLTVTFGGNDPRALEKYLALYSAFLAAH